MKNLKTHLNVDRSVKNKLTKCNTKQYLRAIKTFNSYLFPAIFPSRKQSSKTFRRAVRKRTFNAIIFQGILREGSAKRCRKSLAFPEMSIIRQDKSKQKEALGALLGRPCSSLYHLCSCSRWELNKGKSS